MVDGTSPDTRVLGAPSGKAGRATGKGSSSIRGMAVAQFFLAILPLCVSAQVGELAWRDASLDWPKNSIRPFDEPADLSYRRVNVAQCEALGESPGWGVLDVLAGLPTGFTEMIIDVLQPDADRSEVLSVSSPQDRSILSRLISCPMGNATAHPVGDLVAEFMTREHGYLVGFQDTVFTWDEEPGDIDTGEFIRDHCKILFDTGRKVYVGSYGTRFQDGLRREAFGVASWHAVDFVVGPALVSGYAYLFGWENKFNLLGLNGVIKVEPPQEILGRYEKDNGDLASAAGAEIGFGNFPVKLIVSTGIWDGDACFDFVGIGTSLGVVRQLVSRELSARREPN